MSDLTAKEACEKSAKFNDGLKDITTDQLKNIISYIRNYIHEAAGEGFYEVNVTHYRMNPKKVELVIDYFKKLGFEIEHKYEYVNNCEVVIFNVQWYHGLVK
jgi:hypothetical protein